MRTVATRRSEEEPGTLPPDRTGVAAGNQAREEAEGGVCEGNHAPTPATDPAALPFPLPETLGVAGGQPIFHIVGLFMPAPRRVC